MHEELEVGELEAGLFVASDCSLDQGGGLVVGVVDGDRWGRPGGGGEVGDAGDLGAHEAENHDGENDDRVAGSLRVSNIR